MTRHGAVALAIGPLTHTDMQHAFAAGTATAVAAGLVGYYLVLRAQVFTADALGHVTYTGALGSLVLGINPLLGLMVTAAGVAGAMAVLGPRARADDVTIGSTFAWVLGLGSFFATVYATQGSSSANSRANANYLFGSILGVSAGRAVLVVAIAAGICASMAAIARPLLFASLDEAVAVARGVPVRALGTIFLVLVGVTAAIATQAVGALLLLGLMAAPGGAAHRLTNRPPAGIAVAVLVAVGSTWAGLTLSYYVPQLPPSFAILAVASAAYLAAALSSRRSLPANR